MAKILDRFLVAEQLVDRFFLVRQWVGSGGNSDHFPIFFEIKKGPTNPPNSMKYNKTWLQDDSFKTLFLELWRSFDENLDRSAAFQFAENIKRLKGAVKDWAIAKRLREDAELKQVEEELVQIYEGDGGGFLSMDSKEVLIRLEGRRNTILLEREEAWRLKSRAIWLECGDENTKFFHAYARRRKAANTIWCLKDEEGLEHYDFEGKARCEVNHFESLFRAPT